MKSLSLRGEKEKKKKERKQKKKDLKNKKEALFSVLITVTNIVIDSRLSVHFDLEGKSK